jgi:UPF0755 protein
MPLFNRLSWKLLARISAIIIVLTLVFVGFSFTRYLASRDFIEGDRTTMIAPGTGARAMLKQLHREGLIPPLWLVAFPIFWNHDPTAFKAGEYLIESGSSTRDILLKIARGDSVVHQITLPEGWNLFQIRAAFDRATELTGEFPYDVAEGTIFPAAERFDRGENKAQIVARMQKRMEDALKTAWEKRAPNLPFATKEQALVLASIVEKETGIDAERGRVAAVFINRLRAGMRLQADPTAVYGVEQKKGAPLGRETLARDIDFDSPWNTYTRDGLPPTPICSPGLAAIEAVLNPPDTGEFYFVATGDGGHFFAKTLAEHNQNVARYRQQQKSDE